MTETKPRVLSLDSYSFNFTIDSGSLLRARMGAPAFALRRRRLDQRLEGFWADLAQRYEALWVAAGEGRIDDEGREIRQALLDHSGRDELAGRQHRWELYRQREDVGERQSALFNRAWTRHVDKLRIERLEQQVEDYNRYFPIEANLKTDPETGRFQWMGGLWDPMEAPSREDVLQRFPLR